MMEKETTTLCRYADDVVSYLYDELATRDRDIFEAHLPNCTACTDEFAAVADSRLSVYEWHRDEFLPLQTPRFAIPYEAEPARVRAGVFAMLAEMLTFSRPAFAMAGVAVVLVIGLIAMTFVRPGDEQVAANVEIPTPSAAGPAQAVLPPQTAVVGTPVVPVTTALTPAKAAAKPRTADRSPRKTPANPQRNIQLQQARTAPGLTDEIEIEDDSLRLSDLFEEVGG